MEDLFATLAGLEGEQNFGKRRDPFGSALRYDALCAARTKTWCTALHDRADVGRRPGFSGDGWSHHRYWRQRRRRSCGKRQTAGKVRPAKGSYFGRYVGRRARRAADRAIASPAPSETG